jgi:hypothetical protein
MAQLARSASVAYRAGSILNLSGTAPVLRADRLLQMPGQSPGLYSMLIILKGVGDGLVPLLPDRVSQIGSGSGERLVTGLARGFVQWLRGGGRVHPRSGLGLVCAADGRRGLSDRAGLRIPSVKCWQSAEGPSGRHATPHG